MAQQESTKQQDAKAEELAERFGRSAVRLYPNGNALIVGMTDDIERHFMIVTPNGDVLHDAPEPKIEAIPRANGTRFLVIEGQARQVTPVETAEQAGERLYRCLVGRRPCEIRARIGKTAQDRALNKGEAEIILRHATQASVRADIQAAA